MSDYFSTRSKSVYCDSRRAVLNGLASDGGLYVPARIPGIDYRRYIGLSYPELAKKILQVWFDDFSSKDISDACDGAYIGHFDTPDVCPLTRVGGKNILELFHGETCAFKDVALSVLPRLMSKARASVHMDQKIMILTATSGDTGSAAMNGFKNVEGTGIITFFPNNGVSPVQRRQMVCMEGDNVTCFAVNGNFDDCQTGVKHAFATLEKQDDLVYSSANSINIARLAPQIVYYFSTYLTLLRDGCISEDEKLNFVVPTGNFGDILAGWYAKRMGLPVGKLICASNSNRVLTDFIENGVYDRRREFLRTYSPSMDILISSNLERLLYHMMDEDTQAVSGCMKELSEKGVYRVSDAVLEKIQNDFAAYSFDDDATCETITEFYKQCGYVLDPHSAVAMAAEMAYVKAHPTEKCVVLSTASPFKFPGCVCRALGIEPDANSFTTLKLISEKSGTPVPDRLSELENREEIHTGVISVKDINDCVKSNSAQLIQR